MRWMLLALLLVQNEPKKVKVVATYSFLKYAAEQIGGERVEATALAHPKQDPHGVVPSPDLTKKAGAADLFVALGRSLDLWAKNVLDSSGNPKVQPGTPGHVVASTSCSIEELPGEVSREKGDVHAEGNPHVWLDPLNMKVIAENIAAGLKRIDPDGSATYEKNLAEFQSKIDRALFGDELIKIYGSKRLERRLRSGEFFDYVSENKDKLAGWMKSVQPMQGMKVVSYHKSFTYFAKRFGLQIVAELEALPGIEPKPQDRDRVVEAVQKNGVKVILHENFYSTAASEYVAEKTGARVVKAYLDVGASEEVSDYFKLIDRLIDQIGGR